MENFDIFIYAVISIFLISRLWAVLGHRDEDEGDDTSRPNPFGMKEKPPTDEEDVVVIEGRARVAGQPSVMTPDGYAPNSLAGSIEQVQKIDPTFNEKKFLDGAKMAFEKIVTAFASDDMSSVAWLLGPAVRQPFEKAIAARQAAGQKLDNRIERLAAADIVSAKVEESLATLAVEFVSHQVNLLRDATGQILDGQENRAEEVRDVWVFRRDLRASDPNWQLIETRS